ncbi:hypothetical protein EYF80_021213 [Liparis tanakae]|uniref:Uncharacterized protein n=1 Tax=Liparis tanakae TaxID=230148 RepID=A0A4Z2HS87_9TELE|nr:hypothetical protein EYF80_021213 [Liparis tanakae]
MHECTEGFFNSYTDCLKPATTSSHQESPAVFQLKTEQTPAAPGQDSTDPLCCLKETSKQREEGCEEEEEET